MFKCNNCDNEITEFKDKDLQLCEKCAICELCKKNSVKVYTVEGYYICNVCYKELKIKQRTVKALDIGF